MCKSQKLYLAFMINSQCAASHTLLPPTFQMSFLQRETLKQPIHQFYKRKQKPKSISCSCSSCCSKSTFNKILKDMIPQESLSILSCFIQTQMPLQTPSQGYLCATVPVLDTDKRGEPELIFPSPDIYVLFSFSACSSTTISCRNHRDQHLFPPSVILSP